MKLPVDLNQNIVDGIMRGYSDYLEVREEKFNELRISSAYAYTKGNHIDDQVSRYCEDLGYVYSIEVAGASWKYLQFKNEDSLFIVRNARYFDKDRVSQGKNALGDVGEERSYINRLMQVNVPFFDSNFSKINTIPTQRQLSIEDFGIRGSAKELDKIAQSEKFSRFYIITYEIDALHQIREIAVYLPNPFDNTAIEVENLSEYIRPESVRELDESTLEALGGVDSYYGDVDAREFGITLDIEEAKETP